MMQTPTERAKGAAGDLDRVSPRRLTTPRRPWSKRLLHRRRSRLAILLSAGQ
jgi:hypothetical protein